MVAIKILDRTEIVVDMKVRQEVRAVRSAKETAGERPRSN